MPRTVNSQETTLARDPSPQFKQKTVKENEPSFLQKNWIPLTVGAVTLASVVTAGYLTHGKLWGKANTALNNAGNDFENKGKDWIKYTIEELTTAKATAQGEDLDAISNELFNKYSTKFQDSKNPQGAYLDREAGKKALKEAEERLKRHNENSINLSNGELEELHYVRGELYHHLGHYDEAIKALSLSDKLFPNQTSTIGTMAVTYAEKGEPQTGVDLITKLLKFRLQNSHIRAYQIDETLGDLAICMK